MLRRRQRSPRGCPKKVDSRCNLGHFGRFDRGEWWYYRRFRFDQLGSRRKLRRFALYFGSRHGWLSARRRSHHPYSATVTTAGLDHPLPNPTFGFVRCSCRHLPQFSPCFDSRHRSLSARQRSHHSYRAAVTTRSCQNFGFVHCTWIQAWECSALCYA